MARAQPSQAKLTAGETNNELSYLNFMWRRCQIEGEQSNSSKNREATKSTIQERFRWFGFGCAPPDLSVCSVCASACARFNAQILPKIISCWTNKATTAMTTHEIWQRVPTADSNFFFCSFLFFSFHFVINFFHKVCIFSFCARRE